MTITSRLTLAAAAGMLLHAYTMPAFSADISGGCCDELKKRIAELEATTARKGSRVVSLQVYGQANKALLIFDDGDESDAYIVDNDASGSRFGLTGKATIKPGWTAGFLMEIDVQDAASNNVTQLEGGDDPADEIKIRHNNLWIESEQLGRIMIGQGSAASDGAHGVSLANTLSSAGPDHTNSFFVRRRGVEGDAGLSAAFEVKDFVNDLDGPREDVIRYDTPAVYGFILSAAWGDDDYSDVALRFKKEFNAIRIAAAVSYQWDDRVEDEEIRILGGSASVMHIPTGLFLTASAGARETNEENSGNFWYLQGGIEKKWLPYGATTLYAEYGDYDDFNEGDSEAERFGFGVVQKIDSAAMDIYAQASFWSFDTPAEEFEDLSVVMIGSRLKF